MQANSTVTFTCLRTEGVGQDSGLEMLSNGLLTVSRQATFSRAYITGPGELKLLQSCDSSTFGPVSLPSGNPMLLNDGNWTWNSNDFMYLTTGATFVNNVSFSCTIPGRSAKTFD